ncbi:MAG: DUF2062 domain-containing protein [Thermincolia bacterium]
MWLRRLRYYILRFLRLKGTPRKVALGFAVGSIVNFYPTFGFGVPIAGAVAALVRGNIPAGIVGDILFKPLFPFFFYLDLLVGYKIMGLKADNLTQVAMDLAKLDPQAFLVAGKVFMWGAVINSLLTGLVLFIVVHIIFKSYRRPLIRLMLTKKPSLRA